MLSFIQIYVFTYNIAKPSQDIFRLYRLYVYIYSFLQVPACVLACIAVQVSYHAVKRGDGGEVPGVASVCFDPARPL